MNSLQSLGKLTKIVADTGDLEQVKRFNSVDVTTNPSLILKTLEKGESSDFKEIEEVIRSQFKDLLDDATEKCLITFSVLLGVKILALVPGRVSIEVPSCYSFDRDKTIQIAEEIIELFACSGISQERVLVKIAATYEGIMAAKVLEERKIHCNLTLIFSFFQAVLCGDCGITLISPFVGRIYDWYKKNDPDAFQIGDPGVRSVSTIYHYFKQFGYGTEVMGASFRNLDQIINLAGCDLLTISPALLGELEARDDLIERKLIPQTKGGGGLRQIELNESDFRWKFSQDVMADEKLAEGIRIFHQDFEKQKELIKKIIN